MRSIGMSEVLGLIAQLTGQPVDEFATDEVRLSLRATVACAYGAGRRAGVAAGACELARGLIVQPPDPEAASLVAQRSVELLVARNGGRLKAEDRAVVLRLGEAVREPARLEQVLQWLGNLVELAAPGVSKVAPQSRRLFGPRFLEPVEVTIGLIHPIAAVPADLCSRVLPKLGDTMRGALADAERQLHGRLALRLEVPAEHLPPDSPLSDEELWQQVSGQMLSDVHGLVAVDVARTAVSDGSTHQRLAHRAHAGPGLWVQDPSCRARGRLAAAWAREAGWTVTHCTDPAKLRRIVRRWIVRYADELEWSARSRQDLAVIYGPLQSRLEAIWRLIDPQRRETLQAACSLTAAEIDRTFTDVHFLDSLPGWQLDALRICARMQARTRGPGANSVRPVAWETLLQAQDEYGWPSRVSRALRKHVQHQLTQPAYEPLKQTYRQPVDWLALKRELGL